MTATWHHLFQRLQDLDSAAPAAAPARGWGGESEGRAETWGAGTRPPSSSLKLLLPFLSFLAWLYGLGARLHRGLYARGWLQVKRLPVPVISVGNLSVGGTGKTPMVALLARLYKEQGKKVAVLSRGYGGEAKGVTCVSDGNHLYARPPQVGEEAYWLARALPGVAVYTAPARHAAGLAAWREVKSDFFVLDDGFQHFELHRDLDVVLLDAQAPFGNGRLLPRGPLREPISTLRAAQVLILTRFQPDRDQNRLKMLQEKFPGKTVLTAAILPTKARLFPGGRETPLESLKNQALFAFAGLARPRVFSDTLRDLEVNLIGLRDFPDHYAFTSSDLETLQTEAQTLGAAGLITTAKDWARLGEKWDLPIPLWVLEVEARLEEGGEERLLEAWGPGAGGLHRQEPGGVEALPPPLTPHRQPLPPAVRQRFLGLQVKGRWAGDAAQVRRVLVRAPNWVGDAVMSLPVLAGVQTLFPQAEIFVLAAPRVAPLYTGQPGVAAVVVYPPGREKWRLLGNLRRGFAEPGKPKTGNRKLGFDLGLALPNSFESALGLFLAGARSRLGYDTDARGPFLNLAVTGVRTLAGLHTVYYYLGVLQGLGGVDGFTAPRLYLEHKEVREAAALLNQGKEEGPWVGLSPGAAYGPAKRWPPERFAALGKELQKEFKARLVLLGGPEDRDAGEQVAAGLPGVLNLIGQTGLRQALGVLTHLQLLITNDSGLMHAAAALGTPLVAIFGSTDPEATGPFTSRAAVMHHPLPCSPCLERTCDHGYKCLLDISVAEVMAGARSWLKEGL
jgi:lipopolysaccharide heptosyltransferase II/tetraacyldisaccharide 4'-kinase